MAVDTLTEGSDINTLRRMIRSEGWSSGNPSSIGVLAPTTGGGSAGAGCIVSDAADAMELRLRGNAGLENRAAGGTFNHWSPA